MAPEEHKSRHIELHKCLDELAADFCRQTGKLPSLASIMDLIQWSHGQTEEPTEDLKFPPL